MKNLNRLVMFAAVAVILLMPSTSVLAGPGHAGEGLSPPAMGSDLAVRLNIPLFDLRFSRTPVARVGLKPILLEELTPRMQPKEIILFWDFQASSSALSEQFRLALDERIAREQANNGQVEIFAERRIADGPILTVEAPLFSGLFNQVPVALVNEVPITVADFAQDLQAAHSQAMEGEIDEGSQSKTGRLMERLVTVRLIEQEARNIGFDQTDSFRRQVSAHREKSLLYALLDNEAARIVIDQVEVDKIYREISLEGKFRSLHFSNEEETKRFKEACDKGASFDSLADKAVASGKAAEDDRNDYVKFNELLSKIASEASKMEVGGVSQIFRKEGGFLVFKLVDRRFVEDPAARQYARNIVFDRQKGEFSAAYIKKIIKQYAVIDDQALAALDFASLGKQNPGIQLGDALAPLMKDERALATVSGADPEVLTVKELAGEIRETYFHGVDKALDSGEVDQKKTEIMNDKLFRMAGTVEAKKLGLDRNPQYVREMAEFERRLLFDIFMQKVVTPEVRPTEKEMQDYYAAHRDEYMTPTMFKVRSLAFYKRADAENAAVKLNRGSDFKWVSANVAGMVDFEDQSLLQFDNKILSLTALPESLKGPAADARRGEALVYAEPNNYYYVIYLQDVFPAEPRPYQQVRKEIIQIVYRQAVEKTLEEWVGKLKEAYSVMVYLAPEG